MLPLLKAVTHAAQWKTPRTKLSGSRNSLHQPSQETDDVWRLATRKSRCCQSPLVHFSFAFARSSRPCAESKSTSSILRSSALFPKRKPRKLTSHSLKIYGCKDLNTGWESRTAPSFFLTLKLPTRLDRPAATIRGVEVLVGWKTGRASQSSNNLAV